jgi:Sulfatase
MSDERNPSPKYYQLSAEDYFFSSDEGVNQSASQQAGHILYNQSTRQWYPQWIKYMALALVCTGAFLVIVQSGDLLSTDFTKSWLSILSNESTDETADISSVDSLLSSTGQRPNIVFILADDMGYNSLQKEVTPFLVSMRDNGVKLTRYYSQELCTPSRASLMTGRLPLSLGLQHGSINVQTNGTLGIDETTIADVLKANGYTNYMYGKWNLGNASPRYLPTARGFHQYMGFLSAENDYWSKRAPSNSVFTDLLYSDTECYYMYDGVDLKHYSTNMYRERAIVTIDNHDFDKSPMFLFMSFQAPHAPFADLAGVFENGIPKQYVNDDLYNFINSTYAVRTEELIDLV